MGRTGKRDGAADSKWLTGDTKDLKPDLKQKLQILGKRIGKPIESISGNRTYEEQAELYKAYQEGRGNLAARPGQSNHEHGDAVDAYVDGKPLQEVAGAEAEKLGLGFPVGGEAWHVENVSGSKAPAPKRDKGEAPRGLDYIPWAAKQYGVNGRVLTEIAKRESNFNPNSVNSWDSNAESWKNGGEDTRSKGMFQFIKPTFDSMAPKARDANPKAWRGLGELDHTNWRQQALTTAWAIKTGQGSHWSTYDAALSAAGGDPEAKASDSKAMEIVPKGASAKAEASDGGSGGDASRGSSSTGQSGGSSDAAATGSQSGGSSDTGAGQSSRLAEAEQAAGLEPAAVESTQVVDQAEAVEQPVAIDQAAAGVAEVAPQAAFAAPTTPTPQPEQPVSVFGRPTVQDPASGLFVDQLTGYGVDPASGLLVDPASGWFIDPRDWTFSATQPSTPVPAPAQAIPQVLAAGSCH